MLVKEITTMQCHVVLTMGTPASSFLSRFLIRSRHVSGLACKYTRKDRINEITIKGEDKDCLHGGVWIQLGQLEQTIKLFLSN